jgi:hypothetical protein
MFFEVLSPIYHSPITIESLTYRVLRGTLGYSSSAPHWRQEVESLRPRVYNVFGNSAKASKARVPRLQSFSLY